MALFGVGLVVFLFSGDGGEGNGAAFNPTPSETLNATVAGTSGPSPEPSPTGTASRGNEITLQLLAWSRQQSRWLADRLDDEASYREGESVPLLVRLEGAIASTTYQIALRYQCGKGDRGAFDYLSELTGADAASVLTAPGPGRARADTTIPIPDDPSIDFDDDLERRFQLLGGNFGDAPEGPLPSSQCAESKEFRIKVTAHGPTVLLIVGAHLAAAVDWAEGRGASSQDEPLFSEVSVDGGAPVRVEIAPGAVAQ